MTSTEAAVRTRSDSARAAIAEIAQTFEEFEHRPTSSDPLRWPHYSARITLAKTRTGETESVVAGWATVGGIDVVALAFDFAFLGGSIGEASGDRIVNAIDAARDRRIPLVSMVASGGARIQEGMRSLIQMQRIASAVARLRSDGIPHICVATDPTTGGVWVTLASTADVVIGVRGASVSFAGARVRGSDGAGGKSFTSSGKLEAGAVDIEVGRPAVHGTVARYLRMLATKAPMEPPPYVPPPGEEPDDAWDCVVAARATGRVRAPEYLDLYFDERVPISGDRVSGTDEGMLCGVGRRGGSTIAYAAQTGRANSPAGFRSAIRLLDLAERLRFPVLTLIDTPGAASDAAAENDGVGTAIGELFIRVATLTVPNTSVLLGEGGSGGALALAAPNRLWAAPHSYFAVIAPESAAAIVFRDPGRAPEISRLMALTPSDLRGLGIARR